MTIKVNNLIGCAALGSASDWDFDILISSDVNSYNVYSACGNPVDVVRVRVTIDTGVVIGAVDVATPAFLIDGFDDNSIIKIINNGKIQGAGGYGGYPIAVFGPPYNVAGQGGGAALKAAVPVTVDNAGTIAGGGGGGGADLFVNGGGGAGVVGGVGNLGIFPQYPWYHGTAGTENTGGTGGAATGTYNYNGGAGGSPGSAGGWGWDTDPSDYRSAPGAAGNAVEGDSYITWTSTGTRTGPVT